MLGLSVLFLPWSKFLIVMSIHVHMSCPRRKRLFSLVRAARTALFPCDLRLPELFFINWGYYTLFGHHDEWAFGRHGHVGPRGERAPCMCSAESLIFCGGMPMPYRRLHTTPGLFLDRAPGALRSSIIFHPCFPRLLVAPAYRLQLQCPAAVC